MHVRKLKGVYSLGVYNWDNSVSHVAEGKQLLWSEDYEISRPELK